MARLLTPVTVFFLFLLLSTSHARSATTLPEDDVIGPTQKVDGLAGDSDSKPKILLPSDERLESDSGSVMNIDVESQKDPEEARKFSDELTGENSREIFDKEMPASGSFDSFPGEIVHGGENRLKKERELPMTALTWRPINRQLVRMQLIRRPFPAHRSHRSRFYGGAHIRPVRLPFGEEEKDVVEGKHHRHRRHHREIFSARWINGGIFHQLDAVAFPDVDGEGMMIGEFKDPRFFLGHHHYQHHDHRHRRHHDDDHDQDEDEIKKHKKKEGSVLWKNIRKSLTPF